MPKTLFDLNARCAIDQDLGRAFVAQGSYVVVSI